MTQLISKIGLAVVNDGRLLLCKPHAFDDLIVPGGVREGDETALTNLTREVREELGEGAVLDRDSLQYLGKFSDRAAGKSDRTVEIELYSGNVSGTLAASSEIKELIWFDPASPGAEKSSAVVGNKIIPFLQEKGLLH